MENEEFRNVVSGGTQKGPLLQAHTIHVRFEQDSADSESAPQWKDPWIRAATRSAVWDHVPPTRDSLAFREGVSAIMERLIALRDDAQAALSADPWQDPNMAVRFAEQVEWLLGEEDSAAPLDFYPAEAALLVIIPFLYSTNFLRIAAQHAPVAPEHLGDIADADANRLSFEMFVEGHGMLAKRASLRPEATAPIGWWLFHRWLLHHSMHSDLDDVRELLSLLGEPARALGEVFGSKRVAGLLHGVRRGPDVTNVEFLEQLPSDDRVRAPGHQRVRDQRLVLIAALAYGTCVDMTALPDIIVEHVGIPHPINLDQLRETVEQASWGGQPGFPVLRADCHHEAVIEGLKAYAARADEILHRVHRTARARLTCPMPALPTRLSADDVHPAEGVFDGWAAFRLDERRVRELLMGVQLYKDQDLAVRELYQNALDACRYRRARTEYLDRTEPMSYAYEGRITFEQGTDTDGRLYVECHDNGIGMGDAELRGVFSQAGARFAEQPDFKLERTAWSRLDPPVGFFANSRFGIGVLSYFMLAEELTVTTCRMGLDGRPGPVLEVSIHGPGHLFRIARIAERGAQSGTCVRLYLRDISSPDRRWSCVDVLERVLGIAEFPTSARDGKRDRRWDTGQLSNRRQPDRERFGLDAHGDRVDWLEAPHGVQVTWTERGGGLLVDGLVVQPAIRNGVLSSAESGLSGVVINLTGPYSPSHLSADRAQILDDISPLLRTLLVQAAEALALSEKSLPEFTWVSRIAYHSPQLADLLTMAILGAKRPLLYRTRNIDIGRTGVIPSDAEMFMGGTKYGKERDMPWSMVGEPPDHIYLWRLIAHNAQRTLDQIAAFCPELRNVGPVLPAMPSDLLLLARKGDDSTYWHWNDHSLLQTNELLTAAEKWGVSSRIAAQRATQLSLYEIHPEETSESNTMSAVDIADYHDHSHSRQRRVPTVSMLVKKSKVTKLSPSEVASTWLNLGVMVPDEVVFLAQAALTDSLLLHDSESDIAEYFDLGQTVPPGRIAQASAELGITVAEVCSRYLAYGLQADHAVLTDRPGSETVKLLRDHCDDRRLWLHGGRTMPPAQVLIAAHEIGTTPGEALRRYHDLGIEGPACFPSDATVDDLSLFEDADGGEAPVWVPPGPLPYRLILNAAHPERPLWDVIRRLREYGFAVPMLAPEHPDELDAELLDSLSPCSWWEVHTGEAMPYAHVLAAARYMFSNPETIAKKIESYGIPLSCSRLPAGLTSTGAHELLSLDQSDGEYLSKESQLSLQDLLKRARHLEVSLAQAVEWLTQLGIPLPNLGDTIREALARVPRPED